MRHEDRVDFILRVFAKGAGNDRRMAEILAERWEQELGIRYEYGFDTAASLIEVKLRQIASSVVDPKASAAWEAAVQTANKIRLGTTKKV